MNLFLGASPETESQFIFTIGSIILLPKYIQFALCSAFIVNNETARERRTSNQHV